MNVLELHDPGETRQGTTYRAAPGWIQTDQFAAIDLQALDDDLEATVRFAVMIAMADAGHIPPHFEPQDPDEDYLVAWAPEALLAQMSNEDQWDYYKCLDWAINAVADRFGWPGLDRD